MIQCRHLWSLCLDRSIWKCNSLRTKPKTNKLRCHPFLLTFSQFLMNSRPASAWSGPSCSFPEPEDGVQQHIPTFPGVSPASWGPSSPRRRELSLQQPHFRYFKRQVFLLICSTWTVSAGSRPMPQRNTSVSPSFGTWASFLICLVFSLLDQCIITAVPCAEIGPSFSQHSGVSHHLKPQINSNFLLSNTENCHFVLLVSSENSTVKRIFLPSLQTVSFSSNTALLSPLFSGHIKPKQLGLYFHGTSQLLSALPIVFHWVSRDHLSPSISPSARWKKPQILPPPLSMQLTWKQQLLPSVPETVADGTTLFITG